MSRALRRVSKIHPHLNRSTYTPLTQVRHFAMVRNLIISVCSIIGFALLLRNMQDKKDDILKWAGKDGSFKRQQSQFRNFIENKPGAQFPPEKDRYHLYVSY